MAEMTIKEVAEKYAMNKYDNWNLHPDDHFLAGAKWQEQRMYSEEEVQNILIEYVKTNPTKPYRVVNWFEQFKKK